MRVVNDEKNYQNFSRSKIIILENTYTIVVLVEIFSYHRLVPRKGFLKVSERVTRYPKRRCLNIVRELIESVDIRCPANSRFQLSLTVRSGVGSLRAVRDAASLSESCQCSEQSPRSRIQREQRR